MTQLFVGQTTHPLSAEEKKAFFDKIDLSGRWFSFGDERDMRHALETTIQTPLGAQQAREVIAAPQTDFDISTSRFFEITSPDMAEGGYNRLTDTTYVKSKTLQKPEHSGMIILHELLHARQKGAKHCHKVLVDAETMAVTSQLEMEPGYKKVFDTNYKKWQHYARHPERTPKGALKFKPTNSANKQEARNAYAYQMAMKETMAQFIKTFLQPSTEKDLKTTTPFGRINNRRSYFKLTQQQGCYHLSPEIKKDLLEKYQPFLSETHFRGIQQEAYNQFVIDTQIKTAEQKQLHFSKDDITKLQAIKAYFNDPSKIQKNRMLWRHFKKEKHPAVQQLVQKIEHGQKLHPQEERLFNFMLFQHTDLTNETKTRMMKHCITDIRYPGASSTTFMIHRFQKHLNETLPAQKNDMRDTLRNVSKPDAGTAVLPTRVTPQKE